MYVHDIVNDFYKKIIGKVRARSFTRPNTIFIRLIKSGKLTRPTQILADLLLG